MAYLGKTPSQAVRSRYYFTATGGETSLSGADDNSKTLVFADGNYVDVTLNGVTLVAGTDYNTTTANTIGGLTALTASDVVEVVVYDTFSVFSGNFNGDINLGDNVKANFGAGNDLQIYHDGSNSYIADEGTGNLRVSASDRIQFYNAARNEFYAQFIANGKTALYYDSNEKLATTSTGVDVTGNITSANSGYAKLDLNGTTGGELRLQVSGTTYADIYADSTDGLTVDVATSNQILFKDSGTERMRINSSGNVGIGVSLPEKKLHLTNTQPTTVSATNIMLEGGTNGYGAGVAFGARTSAGGTLVEMAKITADGEDSFNTTASTQDAGLRFFTALDGSLSERMRITSGGNVVLNNASYLQFKDSGGTARDVLTIDAFNGLNINSAGGGSAAPIVFKENGSEIARFDSSGNLLVGKTSSNFGTAGAEMLSSGALNATRSGNTVAWFNRLTSDGTIAVFQKDGTTVGSVSVTGSGTTYNTTSDLRLKTDIQPIDHATDMLMAMNPVSHRWKADPDADAVVGFIAQEMQEIVPEAVSGDADSDEMMAMDYGRITPVLVAALQDAHKKIEQLEQRIADMENN